MSSQPELSPLALRRAYGAYATGVAVVGAHADDGSPVGMTVNSFTSVSLSPPLVSFCPANSCLAFPVYCTMTHFSVNVLTEDQLHISHRFARSGAENKWTGIAYTRGEHGVPIIQDSLVSFECAVERRVEAGDHTIIIGRVLKLHGPANAEPLLFYASAYRKIGQVEGHAAGDLVLLSWGL